ncbi:MAG: kelch repeat-containing protein [Planctomycetota bacterium]
MNRRLLGLAMLVALAAAPLHAQTDWEQQMPPNNLFPRSEFGFSFDLVLGGWVAFGGRDIINNYRSDTLIWNGSNWATIPVTGPSARATQMVYDTARFVHVLYGGTNTGFPGPSDTWEFNGATWSQVVTANSPGPKSEPAMSFDSVANKTVLFSGAGLISIYPPDTWTYDGTNWTNVSPTPAPGGRRRHQMVYDSTRNKHVMFGGESHLLFFYNDTWEYDVALNTWTQVTTANAPSPRRLHAMTFDPIRGVTVLFGGEDMNGNTLGDTWEYDGTNWTQVTTTTTPAPRKGARLASDLVTGDSVMPGGIVGTLATQEIWKYSAIPPALYPGTGADAKIRVATNGTLTNSPTGVYPLTSSDTFALTMVSPLGTLDNAAMALVYSLYPTASPLPGIPLLGAGNPLDVWVDPFNAVVVFDSLAPPTSILVPLLFPGGYTIGPYNVPAGLSGASANLQLFVRDIGANPFNISISDAAVLQFN